MAEGEEDQLERRRRHAAYMRARRAAKSTMRQLNRESWEDFIARRAEKYAVQTHHAVMQDADVLAVYQAAVVPAGTRHERWLQRVRNVATFVNSKLPP